MSSQNEGVLGVCTAKLHECIIHVACSGGLRHEVARPSQGNVSLWEKVYKLTKMALQYKSATYVIIA